MRIVGGKARGRRLSPPKGLDVRPTSDRVREAIFNIIEHSNDIAEISEASIVDVFSGTGAIGLEAMSRGAAHATFIDIDAGAQACARKNIAHLGLWRNATLLKLDATRLPPPPLVADAPCRMAFLDPPYGLNMALPALIGLKDKGWIKTGSVVVIETAANDELDIPRGFVALDQRTYGAARVLFLSLL